MRRTAVIAAFLLILSLGLAARASANTLPGSALYPLKRALEEIRWQLPATADGRAAQALSLAERRRLEAADLVADRAAPEVVMQALQDGARALARAVAFAPGAAVAELAQRWQATIARWPTDYRQVAAGILSEWLEEQPAVPLLPTATPGLWAGTPTVGSAPPTGSPSASGTPAPGMGTVGTPTLLAQPTLPATATPTSTPAAPLATPSPIVPLPTPTLPLPLPTLPLPTATLPLPLPTVPLPTATLPLPTATLPLPLPTVPLPTVTLPLPTVPWP
jgi:hypothetical protein